MSDNTILKIAKNAPIGNLADIVNAWAQQSTDSTSLRRADLLRDKCKAVETFLTWAGKRVENITPADVQEWQSVLERRGYSANSVYGMISKVSSFYNWLLQDDTICERLRGNPCRLVRPKAPRAYQSESVKSLDDDEIKSLLAIVRARAVAGDICGLRDYALLLFYLLTGMRRAEVIGLRWKDIKINGGLILTGRVKGGEIITRDVVAVQVRDALMAYLKASGGRDNPGSPLWLRHDRGAHGQALSSHGWELALKGYAEAAGLGNDIHCHMLRHSYARMVSEDSGSLSDTQEALGHKSISTTRVYVQRVGCKKDKFSTGLSKRLEF